MKIRNILSNSVYKFYKDYCDNAFIVDVRSPFEHEMIGVPYIFDYSVILLQWLYSNDHSEQNFCNKLCYLICKKYFYGLNTYTSNAIDKIKTLNLFFICRSGVRSKTAAMLMTDYGFTNCYNVIDGMEGSKYGNGWINNKLPYILLI